MKQAEAYNVLVTYSKCFLAIIEHNPDLLGEDEAQAFETLHFINLQIDAATNKLNSFFKNSQKRKPTNPQQTKLF